MIKKLLVNIATIVLALLIAVGIVVGIMAVVDNITTERKRVAELFAYCSQYQDTFGYTYADNEYKIICFDVEGPDESTLIKARVATFDQTIEVITIEDMESLRPMMITSRRFALDYRQYSDSISLMFLQLSKSAQDAWLFERDSMSLASIYGPEPAGIGSPAGLARSLASRSMPYRRASALVRARELSELGQLGY